MTQVLQPLLQSVKNVFQKKVYFYTVVGRMRCNYTSTKYSDEVMSWILWTKGTKRGCDFTSTNRILSKKDHKLYTMYIYPWICGDDSALIRFFTDSNEPVPDELNHLRKSVGKATILRLLK